MRHEWIALLVLVALQLTFIPKASSYTLGCKLDGAFIGQIKRELDEIGEVGVLDERIIPLEIEVALTHSEGIRGHKISPAAWDKETLGYLLVVPGNAQRVSNIAKEFLPVARMGFEVFLFDYPGTLGDNSPTLNSIIRDYRSLISTLNEQFAHGKLSIYGISSGGIIALQALDVFSPDATIVLDAVPDSLPWILFCNKQIHPKNVSLDTSQDLDLNLIVSTGDKKVVPLNSIRLATSVREHGGVNHSLQSGRHPFEDGDDVVSRIDLLLGILKRER